MIDGLKTYGKEDINKNNKRKDNKVKSNNQSNDKSQKKVN